MTPVRWSIHTVRRIPVRQVVVEQVCELLQNDRDGDVRVGGVRVPGIARRTLDVPFRERFVVPSASADQILDVHMGIPLVPRSVVNPPPDAYALKMVWLGGIVGAIVGFAVSVLLTEVIFPNNQEWPIAVNAALTVLGALLGSRLARRRFTTRQGMSS